MIYDGLMSCHDKRTNSPLVVSVGGTAKRNRRVCGDGSDLIRIALSFRNNIVA
jgi:hypothetical protein